MPARRPEGPAARRPRRRPSCSPEGTSPRGPRRAGARRAARRDRLRRPGRRRSRPADGVLRRHPHGYVEGAQEAAEQQSRLLLSDPATGDTRVLDLTTAETHDVAPVPGATALTADGRFGFLPTAEGTRVVDTGAWTVDHGDHVHYYRAAIRDVGRIAGGPGVQIRSDAAVTAVTDTAGRAGVYDRTAMETGGPGAPRTLPGTYSGAVVPYGEHLVALTRDTDGPRVVVLDREGGAWPHPGPCASRRAATPSPAAVSSSAAPTEPCWYASRAAVSPPSGSRTARTCPRRNAPPPSTTGRAATPSPPAPASAVWVLDVTDRAWTRVATGPAVAANTAGRAPSAGPGRRRRSARLRHRHRRAHRHHPPAAHRPRERPRRPDGRHRPHRQCRRRGPPPHRASRSTAAAPTSTTPRASVCSRSTTTTVCASPAPSPSTCARH
ncbi:hypothetical protein ACFQ60_41265 [Streptomyces zhihengii]